MVLRLVQLLKALLAIVVGVPLKVIEVRPLQLLNAELPIEVNPPGKEVNISIEQRKKA